MNRRERKRRRRASRSGTRCERGERVAQNGGRGDGEVGEERRGVRRAAHRGVRICFMLPAMLSGLRQGKGVRVSKLFAIKWVHAMD